MVEGAKLNARDLLNFMKIKNGGFPGLQIHKMNQIYLSLETVHGVQTEAEFTTALSSIGSGPGTIWLDSGTFEISSTISLNGGGSIIIKGNGNSTILKPADGVTLFDVTSATGVKFENFKVDTSNYTSDVAVFDIDEASDNLVFFENITIAAGSNYGTGILLTSDNCYIQNCNISGVKHGIYITGEVHQILSNIITGNYNGIYLLGASRNMIMGNYVNSNDSNDANTYAAIYISTNSDNNTIRSNNILNNNNIGAGKTYGIYIDAATSERNVIDTNEVTGNDDNYEDQGTETKLIYNVSTGAEIQNALDSIGTKSGLIILETGTITLTTPILINGGGDYTIEGGGETTIIDINGDYSAFNITSAQSCTLKGFKIDASDLITPTIEVINITEASNNKVFVNNVTIVGDGTNGYGLEINSNNCNIENCTINNVNYGIHVLGQSNRINNNIISSCVTAGIYLTNAEYNIITDNNCSSNIIDGIYLTGSSYNKISRNVFNTNSQNGIYLTGSSNNTISQNTIDGNDSNTANPQAGIYITTNSDNNVISGNNSINNNNSGVGSSYGLYIANSTCNDNKFSDNNYSGNDIFILDNGTNTNIIYFVSNATDLQNAINSIAAKSGTIKLFLGTITLSTTITIAGGGDYIIEGYGNGSIIDINGDYDGLYVTSAKSCIFRNFYIDCSDPITPGTNAIYLLESSNNPLTVENVSFYDDNNVTTGIYVGSANCIIKNNYLDGCSQLNAGIKTASSSVKIESNVLIGCGIQITNNDYNIVVNNYITTSITGITCQTEYNTVSNNIIRNCTSYGINCQGDYNSFSGNELISNDIGIRFTGDENKFSDDNIYYNSTTQDIEDSGVNNSLIYKCGTRAQIVNAISSIADKDGIIKLTTGTISVGTQISFAGSGSIIVEGNGPASIIDISGNNIAFYVLIGFITFKNFKITCDNITDTTAAIQFDNLSNSKCIMDNIIIDGTGNGEDATGVDLDSNNCIIQNCSFIAIRQAINIAGDNNIIQNCLFSTLSAPIGTDLNVIYISGGNKNKIIDCNFYDNDSNSANPQAMIYFAGNSDDNLIDNCLIFDNNNAGAGDTYGIYISAATVNNTIIGKNRISGNDKIIGDNGTDTIGGIKYLEFMEWESDNETNVDVQQKYDSTEYKLYLDINATGAAASVDIICQFRIPNNFQGFLGDSDDIVVRAITDAGADRDSTITINFIDTAGTDSDDDSVNGTTLTSSYVNYDCSIDAGSFSPNDIVILKLTFSLPDADDGVSVEIPEIKCY